MLAAAPPDVACCAVKAVLSRVEEREVASAALRAALVLAVLLRTTMPYSSSLGGMHGGEQGRNQSAWEDGKPCV